MDLYAFWRYDIFPYVLHGEVSGGPDAEGRVTIKSYGKAYGFTPIRLVNKKGGQVLGERLDALRAEYKQAQADLDAEFHEKLAALSTSFLPERFRSS